MSLNKVYIYRMTHVDNIPHIIENGITHKNSRNANINFKPIGDSDLISTRADRQKAFIRANATGPKTIKLGDFTPFYFGCRMPMLYVIQNGYNNVKRQPPEDIIYIVSSVRQIVDAKLSFYFTDGHAIDFLSKCYDDSMADQLINVVDLAATKVRDWTTERDLKRRMEAEFLVAGDIPASRILGYVCYNKAAEQKLLTYGIKTNILINSNRYF